MCMVTTTSTKRAKAVALVWVLGDHIAAQWGQTVNGTQNSRDSDSSTGGAGSPRRSEPKAN
jgi:hypothetical protein